MSLSSHCIGHIKIGILRAERNQYMPFGPDSALQTSGHRLASTSYELSHIGSESGFKPLTSEVGGECVTHTPNSMT